MINQQRQRIGGVRFGMPFFANIGNRLPRFQQGESDFGLVGVVMGGGASCSAEDLNVTVTQGGDTALTARVVCPLGYGVIPLRGIFVKTYAATRLASYLGVFIDGLRPPLHA